jgi:hypothetical protein
MLPADTDTALSSQGEKGRATYNEHPYHGQLYAPSQMGSWGSLHWLVRSVVYTLRPVPPAGTSQETG